MVGQKAHFVDVEDSAVGRGEQAGPQPGAAFEQRSFEIERADDPVLGGADGQLHERCPAADQRGQGPGGGRLPRSLLPPDQNAAELRVDGVQQRASFRSSCPTTADSGKGCAGSRSRGALLRQHLGFEQGLGEGGQAVSEAFHRPRVWFEESLGDALQGPGIRGGEELPHLGSAT